MSLLDYITHYQEAHPWIATVIGIVSVVWIATVIGIVSVVWITARYLMKSNDLENYKLLEEKRAEVDKLSLEIAMFNDKFYKERDKYMNPVYANANKGK